MRVTTFNILHGRSPHDERVDVGRLERAVRRLAPDVLGLQEVDRDQERSGRADLTAVAAEAMSAHEHRFVAALAGTPGATWTAATGNEQPHAAAYGVALLSRFPVHSWEMVRLPALPGRVPMLRRGRLELVSDEPRVAVSAVVEAPEGMVTVATTHLSFIRGWNVVQLRRVVRGLRRCPAPRLLVGDLNMGPATARRATGMRTVGEAHTFPAGSPSRQLDHVLVDGLDGPFRSWAEALDLSDHLALTVETAGAGATPAGDRS